ncbi:hypothetical protein [Streptomyces sp. NPDC001914]|uniref:hypothetical protein n=1 Tax=Streptomyces sp. NPDC001914 TaxID=3364623 RepID=UPI0036A55222
MKPSFTRGFRLHLPGGRFLDGAEFPSGRSLVVDDPEHGLATAATSMEQLLGSYHGSRVEWPGDQLVPSVLFEDLAASAAELAAATPSPAASRAVAALARLSTYLGHDVSARAAEARPPRVTWHVEAAAGDTWLQATRPVSARASAETALTGRRQRHPDREFRIVRTTTTHIVEES